MSNKNTSDKKASTAKAAAKKKNTPKKTVAKKATAVKSVPKKASTTRVASGTSPAPKKKAGRPPKSATPKKAAYPSRTASNTGLVVSRPTNTVPTGVELQSATSTTAATGAVADSVVMSLSWQKSAVKPTKWQRFKNFFRPSGRKKKS